MKFSEYPYERPDYEQVKAQLEALMAELQAAPNADAFMEIFDRIIALRGEYSTMRTICSIRNSINTKDEFYDKETEYWNEYGPLYRALENKLSALVLNCPFVEDLKKIIPGTYFTKADYANRSFREDVIPDLQAENKLVTEYKKLIASAAIEFEGKTYNLMQLQALTKSPDRELREKAYNARMGWFEENEAKIDDIFDRMVHLRDGLAKKLGFKNFTELGYVRMERFDYDENDVNTYRSEVVKHMVPVVNKLFENQKQRLGMDRIRYFDESIEFLSGNPTPKGTPEELVAAAQKMYHEMSPETGEFIDVMVNGELMDLVSKPGKAGGGYCTRLQKYKVPFVFANFNGTSADADVLTHEMGHAFQAYQSNHIRVPECTWASKESAEIFSMAMEFFAQPWYQDFFKEDTEKYFFSHLADTVRLVTYGVLVDHFQHEVYNNPDMTPAERKACWRRLEKIYRPNKDYEGCDILERGCWWYQQQHIFASPFYYIDYTLAQICALQFWKRSQVDKDPQAWPDYLSMCKCGGTLPFRQLLKVGHLREPFQEGILGEVMESLCAALDAVDTSKM